MGRSVSPLLPPPALVACPRAGRGLPPPASLCGNGMDLRRASQTRLSFSLESVFIPLLSCQLEMKLRLLNGLLSPVASASASLRAAGGIFLCPSMLRGFLPLPRSPGSPTPSPREPHAVPRAPHAGPPGSPTPSPSGAPRSSPPGSPTPVPPGAPRSSPPPGSPTLVPGARPCRALGGASSPCLPCWLHTCPATGSRGFS